MVLLTVLSDTYHGLPRHRRGLQPERHYYTANTLFEQSLDIYRPVKNAAGGGKSLRSSGEFDTSVSNSSAIVVLVVGSAWLGHRSILYSGTSWWNSSGPKAVAELGYVCVCVSFLAKRYDDIIVSL
jgi:hypothetical protein